MTVISSYILLITMWAATDGRANLYAGHVALTSQQISFISKDACLLEERRLNLIDDGHVRYYATCIEKK